MAKKTPTKKLTAGELKEITQIRKRDYTLQKFDLARIEKAITKALQSTKEGGAAEAKQIATDVFRKLLQSKKEFAGFLPTVEGVQDLVERQLILGDFNETAKSYIAFRDARALERAKENAVPKHVAKLAKDSKKYFRNSLGEFVYYRTYSRWIEAEKRRETWIETVERYISFMQENVGDALTAREYNEIRQMILTHSAMPSMRLMQFAGEPARKTNVCAYNCSFIAPERLEDFAEIMYISMCGTGVGFSVEDKFVQKLPQIEFQKGNKAKVHVVGDSKEGWADALTIGLKAWFSGEDVTFDYSRIRPAGARLKTMGGKSSGPEPLKQLMQFAREKIMARQGRRLTDIDVHDIVCKIGEIVVAGGVRRSALISLSDLDSETLRDAKTGQFWNTEPQRSMANNSAVYEHKPSVTEFMEEWMALVKSGSGERGIFNRAGLLKTLPERRLELLNNDVSRMGTNPCGEILLQSKQFCNLTEVIARAEDTEKTLIQKARIAAILGTFQSSLTNFPYLSKEWKENCETERLLGVSVTGQWDCKISRDPKVLEKIKKEAIRVNRIYAKKFGIPASSCITTVKPSGTVSQTVDCASGMHPRFAPYYIRRVRIASSDSLFKMLRDQGVPYKPEVGQSMESASTYVFEFPVKSPKGSICNDDLSALEQLEHWKVVKTSYTEHNPSVTIYIGDDEWLTVANWLYENWDIVGGLSFLPRQNHVYQLAPYEAIDEKTYKELHDYMKNIDFSKIVEYEKTDEVDVKKELACAGGVCEII